MEKLHKPEQYKESDIFFTRHAESAYKTYARILKSENPLCEIDYSEQIEGDLTEEGKQNAEMKAKELLSSMDPEKDMLFFVSSKENRAIETASIYRDIAIQYGFEIIDHGNKSKENNQNIRELTTLSLKNIRPFVISIFTPDQYQTEINWHAIDSETREKWIQARNTVEKKDYGNWGENFYRYADEIKDIFPEIKTSLELFKTQFSQIQRLASFARNKINETHSDKMIKILAFGHEDYMSIALEKDFFKSNLEYCETIIL
jgi:hypothetical protein